MHQVLLLYNPTWAIAIEGRHLFRMCCICMVAQQAMGEAVFGVFGVYYVTIPVYITLPPRLSTQARDI